MGRLKTKDPVNRVELKDSECMLLIDAIELANEAVRGNAYLALDEKRLLLDLERMRAKLIITVEPALGPRRRK